MEIPEELRQALHGNEAAKSKFEALPPSHQREYVQHVAEAKKSETRLRRAQKCIEMLTKSPLQ